MEHILDYLERAEKKYPHRLAVDDGNVCFNWSELLKLSRRMGSSILNFTEMGKPVAILAEKSAVTLAAMFGTVYAGCFYVMIDPSQPAARLNEILRILEPKLIITDNKNEERLEEAGYCKRSCLLGDMMQAAVDTGKLKEIREKSSGSDLLYGIFTSGSTGTPKGIVVSHKAVVDFISHFTETFGITEEDRIGNQAPFDFDVSVKDIYTSVMTGASLVLIPKKMFCTPPVLLDYLCEKKVTTLIWAVSALTLVSALKGLRYRVPCDVKRVMFSGEIMPAKQLRLWQEAIPRAEFINLYGPTEITCNCTYYPVKRIFEDGERLPIGRPFPGRRVFLLDEGGKEVTIPEEPGEICVAGESLSEGYYNNPRETEARFVYPFPDEPKVRCYRTGDLGYYGRDGELYFCGRKDFQVKHMGHRIELEEIEHSMNQIQGLEKSCCLMDYRKNQLVAFYLGEAATGLVRTEMKKRVPVYMVPHKIIPISQMPLTKNGKTDRDYFRSKLEEVM